MTETSGSFTGRTRLLNIVSLTDVVGHELHTVEVVGTHSSPDKNWNNARVTYWATSDLVAGNGSQRGYYVTEHPDGGRDQGTFEGKVTTSQGATQIEGTWHTIDGTGIYTSMRGEGTFSIRMTSATEGECSWQGHYELAATAQAA